MSDKIITKNTKVKLTAKPDEGYDFVKWSNGETSNPLTITVEKIIRSFSTTAKLTAIFDKTTPTPDPDPEPTTKQKVSCFAFDIDIANSIEGNGWSGAPGVENSECSVVCDKIELDADEEFTLTTSVPVDREVRNGYIIIKDNNYIPSDKIKENYKNYIAFRFGESGLTTSINNMIAAAQSYDPKNYNSLQPLPIYTIAKSTEDKANRIYKTSRAQHNTWFYTFGNNTDWVNRRLYFSDESWANVKSIVDNSNSDVVCILVASIKHEVKNQGFKKVYQKVNIQTDENGVRIAKLEEAADITGKYWNQYVINKSACPLNNPEYFTLNKVNSVNFSLAGGDTKIYDEQYILYQVPDEGDYKGKWIAISTDDKQKDVWSETFTTMRSKIPSLWFVNMSGDGISFLWTVTQNPQIFALDVTEKS